MTNWFNHLRGLRQEGYADALAGRPMRHGCLASREERLEYCKGYEDWQEENVPRYVRWTHRESQWHQPIKLDSERDPRASRGEPDEPEAASP